MRWNSPAGSELMTNLSETQFRHSISGVADDAIVLHADRPRSAGVPNRSADARAADGASHPCSAALGRDHSLPTGAALLSPLRGRPTKALDRRPPDARPHGGGDDAAIRGDPQRDAEKMTGQSHAGAMRQRPAAADRERDPGQ